jgi:phospholipase/carboxylesterase
MNRRQFGTLTVGAIVSFACDAVAANDGRITVRPRANTTTTLKSGRLGLEDDRDAILQLPEDTSKPMPLLVFLHGATQRAEGMMRRIGAPALEAGVAVLAPDSRAVTWDAIRGKFGPDIVFINRALQRVFEGVSIDPARIAIGGFSDGASYALSLGIINGDLFSHIVAFSPGFVVNGTPHGTPRFFFSHGTGDPILPIDQSSRVIVPGLKRRGLDVTYQEFDGGHQVPPDVARDAMLWLAGPKGPALPK